MTPEKITHCLQERLGIHVSATTIRRLLTQLDYSLKGNSKTLSAGSHPDRDKQFGIIEHLRGQFSAAGDPVISVDTKEKELTLQRHLKCWMSARKDLRKSDRNDDCFGSQGLPK